MNHKKLFVSIFFFLVFLTPVHQANAVGFSANHLLVATPTELITLNPAGVETSSFPLSGVFEPQPCLMPNGNILLETFNGFKEVTPEGQEVRRIALNVTPTGATIGPKGHLFFTAIDGIYELDLGTEQIVNFIPVDFSLVDDPIPCFMPNGNILVKLGLGRLAVVDMVTAEIVRLINMGRTIGGMAPGPDGTLIVTSTGFIADPIPGPQPPNANDPVNPPIKPFPTGEAILTLNAALQVVNILPLPGLVERPIPCFMPNGHLALHGAGGILQVDLSTGLVVNTLPILGVTGVAAVPHRFAAKVKGKKIENGVKSKINVKGTVMVSPWSRRVIFTSDTPVFGTKTVVFHGIESFNKKGNKSVFIGAQAPLAATDELGTGKFKLKGQAGTNDFLFIHRVKGEVTTVGPSGVAFVKIRNLKGGLLNP